MKLSIEQILDIPGAAKSFAGELNLSETKRHGEVLFPTLLAVSGEVSNRAGVVTLRYQISGSLPFLCDRCLKQSELSLIQQFTHIVVRSLRDEELEDVYLLAPDGVLDLLLIATADLLLDLPQVFCCQEDCKGICPCCGVNRNEEPCNCC